MSIAYSQITGTEHHPDEDEQREGYVESHGGVVAVPWRPTECRRRLAVGTITGGNPQLVTVCRED